MNDQRQITPTLGPGKLVIIGVMAGTIRWFVFQSQLPSRSNFYLIRNEFFLCGCLYGLIAAGCWLATAVNHRYLRLAVRVSIVAGSVFLFSQLRENRGWFQIAADLSGLAIAQCMMFYIFRVPKWRTTWASELDHNAKRIDQFTIADIAITTTVIAALLAMVIRHSPSIHPIRYWIVLAMAWAGGSIVTMLIGRGMTSRSILKTIGLVTTGLMIAFVGTYAIAAADSLVKAGEVPYNAVRRFVSAYGWIVAGYVATFSLFAGLARISFPDATEPQTHSKPSSTSGSSPTIGTGANNLS